MHGFEHKSWNPLGFWTGSHPLFYVNADTLRATWIIIGFLTISSLIIHYILKKNNTLAKTIILYAIDSLRQLVIQTIGYFYYPYFAFFSIIFIYILTCNWISLIPGIEEPTADLNTALALGCISFFYKEIETIRVHGLRGYIKEFLEPFFLFLPINVIGHFSKIISISFRLFGNIFGGSIITTLYTYAISHSIIFELLGIITGINFVVLGFFTLFEGLIQAFVFAVLSLTYLAIATSQEKDH